MNIPLLKISATEAVVESLTQRIKNGEFGPGEKLPSEQALLKEYDVSRLTLREALAKLTAWGMIQVRHGKGSYVSAGISVPALDNVLFPFFPEKDRGRMHDLIEARNMIESEITVMVAKTRTLEQIRQLELLLQYDPSRITSAKKFAEQDYLFHLTLSQMAGNEFIFTMYQALSRQIHFFLTQYAQSIKDFKNALERHQPILAAIIDQDPERAGLLAREHAKICASYIHKFKTDAD